MFKNVEESMYMIGRQIKDANWISTNKICNVCDENYSRWNQQQIRRKINEPESIKTKSPKMDHRGKKKGLGKINRVLVSRGTISSNLIYMSFKSMKEKRGKDRKNIGRNNGQTISKFDAIHTQAHSHREKEKS